jgi:RimJ/RimL family protein N-acetyltransferase
MSLSIQAYFIMATQNEQTPLPAGFPAPSGPAVFPPGKPLVGQTTSVVPLRPAHAADLYKHLGGEENLARWVYMTRDGYRTFSAFEADITAWSESKDPVFYAVLTVRDKSAASSDSDPSSAPTEAVGILAYLAITPAFRRVEIGYVIFGQPLVRSRQATEAFYLFMRHAFDDLGYTRVEWKANKFNEPSVRAATRLGFFSEGVFRCVHASVT